MLGRCPSLMGGEWSCYGGGQFKGRRIVMLQRWSVKWRHHFTEVIILIEGEGLCYGGGLFNGGSMFMLHRWSV